METKNCQNCKNDFTIGPDDFSFYEKIKVPPPTFCPECRMIRRMAWRNVRSLYKRECELCKKVIISMYPDDGVPVMCADCFNGDNWNQYEYAKDIDWSLNFFTQIYELIKKQPRVFQYRLGNVVNSDYGNSVVNSKDAYLTYSVIDSENVMYSESIDKSRDSIDCLIVHELDQCSWNICSDKNYNCHYIVNSQSNIDSYFLFDCANCVNCCLSSNLRNKSYFFNNEQLSKEEYTKKVAELKLNTISGFYKTKDIFNNLIKNSIHRYAQIYSSINATGDFIKNSRDVVVSFDIQNSENVRHSARIITAKDVMDCYAVLAGELQYETMSGTNSSYNHIGSILCFYSKNMEYSMFCKNCSDCFGCIGIKNSKYCILNKQYTEEEYKKLVLKLRQHMDDVPFIDSKNRIYKYGEFYPFEFSPFSYNETITQYYFPLSEKIAQENGYNWLPREKRNYSTTIEATDLEDTIEDVKDSILNDTIGCIDKGDCEHQCTGAFRVMPNELQFLRAKNLPLPQKCPNCRHYERLELCNSYKLYTRICSNGCGNVFQTSYAPDRPERVYCESCYQKEVL